ncbi:uncharacterized protein CcaverHIS019_0410440 [Cutaneotrichosporon cavernicola]|uniref:Amino acid transporter n=1 Tax=Cutaneotrichosporon cavernicola TaxID=279322 RepID=A0AA48L587_9TREE|nr:uncharacterized protein CcaverHIS019_0410440 [Cutaneotrichosporon cavernicola]BEI92224.1 hypothetical protein CcaverHIS019_0410440 [Cutaneotrichosporon cavernicola]BEI99995.1 hypothetical protein CcaverHIS631_0410380 [Cutaneotrichosporon cavernicola]BEJ07768.1 hypothetical protein CcaverHIS641_0410370 [Cutaneotrichosporon cavernicola]
MVVEHTKEIDHTPAQSQHSKEDGNVTVIECEADLAGDEGLHELGYKAELHRTRGFREVFAMSLTCMAVPYGYGTALYTGIIGGGPATLIWGSVIVTILQWTVAFSLGELASRWPTSAGAYYWTFQLAPKRFRTIFSYINGWMLLTALLLTTTSVAFGMGQHIIGTIQIVRPDWAPASWVYNLVAYALIAVASVPLLMPPRFLTILEQTNVVMIWVYKLAHIIVLSVRAKAGRRSAKYAFTHYDPSFSGWGQVWTFFIGFLPAAYANAAPGFVVAMIEETHNPEINVPRAMSYTMMPASLILAWGFLLPLTFTMPPSEVLLEAPGGIILPYAYKLIVGNDAGAILLMVGMLYMGFNCLVGINTTASRQLWSFSRDHAVPGSAVWSRVNKSGNVPYAVALCLLVQCLLCLINLGSSVAFNSFVSTAVNAFAASYMLPVLLSVLEKRRSIAGAPFTRHVVGWICNISVIIWVPLALVIFSMPIALPVTPDTMNYASVVFAGFITIAAVWYVVYARRVYEGPPESMGM